MKSSDILVEGGRWTAWEGRLNFDCVDEGVEDRGQTKNRRAWRASDVVAPFPQGVRLTGRCRTAGWRVAPGPDPIDVGRQSAQATGGRQWR